MGGWFGEGSCAAEPADHAVLPRPVRGRWLRLLGGEDANWCTFTLGRRGRPVASSAEEDEIPGAFRVVLGRYTPCRSRSLSRASGGACFESAGRRERRGEDSLLDLARDVVHDVSRLDRGGGAPRVRGARAGLLTAWLGGLRPTPSTGSCRTGRDAEAGAGASEGGQSLLRERARGTTRRGQGRFGRVGARRSGCCWRTARLGCTSRSRLQPYHRRLDRRAHQQMRSTSCWRNQVRGLPHGLRKEQVTGAGAFDVVLAPGTVSHLDLQWESRVGRREIEAWSSVVRLVRFDKHGSRLLGPTDERGDARGEDRRHPRRHGRRRSRKRGHFRAVGGRPDGLPVCCDISRAHRWASCTWGTMARWVKDERHPWGLSPAEHAALLVELGENWPSEYYVRGPGVGLGEDPRIPSWWPSPCGRSRRERVRRPWWRSNG